MTESRDGIYGQTVRGRRCSLRHAGGCLRRAERRGGGAGTAALGRFVGGFFRASADPFAVPSADPSAVPRDGTPFRFVDPAVSAATATVAVVAASLSPSPRPSPVPPAVRAVIPDGAASASPASATAMICFMPHAPKEGMR